MAGPSAADLDAGYCEHGPFDACRCLFQLKDDPVFLIRDEMEIPVPTFVPSPTPKK